MNTELLRCSRMTTGILFPARQFQPTDLNRLYTRVTEQYPYANLQHLPDGIRMANQDNDCILQGGMAPQHPGRLQINENNMFHFEPAKQKAVNLFDIICNDLGLEQYLSFGIKLTAFLPVEGGNSGSIVENAAMPGFKSVLDQLGPGRQGTGLRVVVHNNGAYDLHIEPFFADLSQLYIELDVQHPEPGSGLSLMEERMTNAYRFLDTDVRAMLSQM